MSEKLPKTIGWSHNFFNNSITKGLISQLPGGRDLESDSAGCPILQENATLLYLIIPGWEGIPTNFILNLFFSALFIAIMIIILLIVDRMEKKRKRTKSDSSNMLQFVYGRRTTVETVFYNKKKINREHPKAYLPVVLHQFSHLIQDRIKEDATKLDFFSSPVGTSRVESTISELANSNITEEQAQEEETIRSLDAVLNNDEDKSDDDDRLKVNEDKQIKRLVSIIWDEQTRTDTQSVIQETQSSHEYPSQEFGFRGIIKMFLSWILIKDTDILKKKGFDAIQYLIFQRYIIYYLTGITIICMFVILPIHLNGQRLKRRGEEDKHYHKTTILNVENKSSVAWIHVLMTIFIVLMGIYTVQSFSQYITRKDRNTDKKILMIENIPKSKRKATELRDFLEKKFPNIVIKRITFVYDVNDMISLMTQLWTAIEAKKFCRQYEKQYGQKCEVRPYTFGNFLGLFCLCKCFPKVNGFEYYSKEKIDLESKIETEAKNTIDRPTDKAFIVFETKSMAKHVFEYFAIRHGHCYTLSILFYWICGHDNDPYNSWQWYVHYAPYPDDIQWEGIGKSALSVWIMTIVMNILILVVFAFLSTPSSALNIIMKLLKFDSAKYSQLTTIDDDTTDPLTGLVWAYLPTFVLLSLAVVLPAAIKGLTLMIPYRTKSEYNHAVMYKVYLFLILMVLILPSLVMDTAISFFQSSFKVNATGDLQEIKWGCLFPTENGAFFTNYVVTSIFVGNLIDFSRMIELCIYVMCLAFISRNPAEYLKARQSTQFEFYFGIHYPRFLLIVTLILTFCISSPLIAPIGLIFMIFKHLVDRYLIYHVYTITKINQRVHSKAVLFFNFGLTFLLFQVYNHLASMYSGSDDRFTPSFVIGFAFVTQLIYTLFETFYDLSLICMF